ncbi:hypothetical protein D3C78_1265500 [compost metagenome]
MILVRQIIAPIPLTHRTDKRLDAVIARVHATAELATYGVPQIIDQWVALVMEHRRHRLTASCHQHRRNIHRPPVWYQENHVTPFFTDFIQHFFTVPANALQHFLRLGTGQLRHQDHRLRCGGEHLVDDMFTLIFGQLRQAVQQIDARTASSAFCHLAGQFTYGAEHRIAQTCRHQ